MQCPACGSENESGRKFCLSCGQRLAVACPHCGVANTPGVRFCGECGNAIEQVDAPAAVAVVGATVVPATERRLVSVLFADLVGFTRSAEERDPEDVRELLTRYFDLAREVIDRYGGTVEKFIGDAVMAVWGTPVAREDDAERAVRAALDLVDAVRPLGDRAGVRAGARAGVLTGEAAVTIGATSQGMVAGDLVNTAVAPPVRRAAGDASSSARRPSAPPATRSPTSPPASRLLKGKTAPSPLAGPARRGQARRRGRAARASSRPSSAATSELRLLKDSPRHGARRRPRLVSVIGQAGIGKSRLAWEFQKYIDGLVEDVYWHQGRSPAYGEGITLLGAGRDGPQARRPRGERRRGDDARSDRGRRSTEYVPDADERRWIEPALLPLLGIERGAGRGARGALRGLADLLRAHRASAGRRCSCSRTSTGPTRACSTSSSIC